MEWIDIEERTPDEVGTRALIYPIDEEYIEIAEYIGEGNWAWYDYKISGMELTHWMPLPEPPEVDK